MRADVLARNIRACRVLRGFSQQALAGRLRVHQQTISRTERGARRIRNLAELLTYARALDVDPLLLMTDAQLAPFASEGGYVR